MNQQELIWVRLPYSSLTKAKIRPAVIISNNVYNKSHQDVVVCAITPNVKQTTYSVLIDQKSLSNGNLPIKSRIKADKVMQIEKSLILKPFAKLKDEVFDGLISEIDKLIERKS